MPAPAAAPAPAVPAHDPASQAAHQEIVSLYFDSGSAVPGADAGRKLERLVAHARAYPTVKLTVAGYHDRTGDPAANEELAKQRARAVRDLLTAAGVPEDRIVLRKPFVTAGDGNEREARRVEVATE